MGEDRMALVPSVICRQVQNLELSKMDCGCVLGAKFSCCATTWCFGLQIPLRSYISLLVLIGALVLFAGLKRSPLMFAVINLSDVCCSCRVILEQTKQNNWRAKIAQLRSISSKVDLHMCEVPLKIDIYIYISDYCNISTKIASK